MASNRKPLNDVAGYVCQRKCKLGGYIAIIDRNNGGDWIDADKRWIVMHFTADLACGRFVEDSSLPKARETMVWVAEASSYDEAARGADILPAQEARDAR